MRYLLICVVALFSSITWANPTDRLKEASFPSQLNDSSHTLQRKSQGVLTYLWADVYAAALFNEPGVSPEKAFAERRAQCLELYYFRDIDRSDVIKAANATLQRQQSKATLAHLQPALDKLHASFQDIQRGDRYRLSFEPDQGMRLERNGQLIFSSPDTELASVYLGLWLAPDGLSKALRATLLDQG